TSFSFFPSPLEISSSCEKLNMSQPIDPSSIPFDPDFLNPKVDSEKLKNLEEQVLSIRESTKKNLDLHEFACQGNFFLPSGQKIDLEALKDAYMLDLGALELIM